MTLAIFAYQIFIYTPQLREAQEYQRQLALEEQAREEERLSHEDLEGDVSAKMPTAPDTSAGLSPPAVGLNGAAKEPPTNVPEPRYITVSSELYDIVLSSAGAEIVSTTLMNYETEGIPVQIVRSDETQREGIGHVELVGDERRLSLRGVDFEVFLPSTTEPLADGTVIPIDPSLGEKTVIFRTGGLERRYTFYPDQYVVRSVIRLTASAFPFARQVSWGFGTGLKATETNAEQDYAALRSTVMLGEERYKHKRGDFEESRSGVVQWAALQTKYFTAVMLPDEPTSGDVRVIGEKGDNYMTAWVTLPARSLQGSVEQSMDFYLGPLDDDRLKAVGRGLEKNIDIGFEHVKIFKPVSQAVLWSMKAAYKIIPNYGIVIIIISVFTKVLFYRLTHKSFKSMRDMQQLQPKMQALKEKYKDDRKRLSEETMKLYKESGVNPLGGCLPMLLQMPVFIALFSVLRNTIEVRRAPFFGWINDLSQQDVLATLPVTLPFIGDAVSVLPLLMGASMLMQSKIGGSIAGPGSGASQPKAFTYMLPIVFTVLFYRMPSGLVVYWLVNTVLSVAQQYYINKGADKEQKEKEEREKAGRERAEKERASKEQEKAITGGTPGAEDNGSTPTIGKATDDGGPRRSRSARKGKRSRSRKGRQPRLKKG